MSHCYFQLRFALIQITAFVLFAWTEPRIALLSIETYHWRFLAGAFEYSPRFSQGSLIYNSGEGR
jgi:hypothetical protein